MTNEPNTASSDLYRRYRDCIARFNRRCIACGKFIYKNLRRSRNPFCADLGDKWAGGKPSDSPIQSSDTESRLGNYDHYYDCYSSGPTYGTATATTSSTKSMKGIV